MTLEDAKVSLHRYAEHGLLPGGFLTAVLENNLHEAVSRADESSQANLAAIVCYVVNELPWRSWGSPAAVEIWVRERRKGRKAVVTR